MIDIIVDKEKCINRSICSNVCAYGIIKCSNEKGYAEAIATRKGKCAACGQCEAHCPKGAISIEYQVGKSYSGVKPISKVTSEQIGYHMASRRSVRNYKNESVDKNTLDKLMEIVRFAPTGRNTQDVGWIVVHNTEKLKNILDITMNVIKEKVKTTPKGVELLYYLSAIRKWEKGRDLILRNSPHLIIAYAPDEGMSANADAIIGLTYFELAAASFGIGTCWAGIFKAVASQSEEIKKELGIPENKEVCGALMFGYPKFKSYRIPKRNPLNIKWI